MLQKLVLVVRLRDMAEISKSLPKELKKESTELINTDLQELKRQDISGLLSKANVKGDPLADESIEWALGYFELEDANREFLEEALKHGIPHNVLNAKYHEREALIIAEAGRKGQITIATNMAGPRGGSFLGGRVFDELLETSLTA